MQIADTLTRKVVCEDWSVIFFRSLDELKAPNLGCIQGVHDF
jgi:hypothetical protein